jgi:hypothetical protein
MVLVSFQGCKHRNFNSGGQTQAWNSSPQTRGQEGGARTPSTLTISVDGAKGREGSSGSNGSDGSSTSFGFTGDDGDNGNDGADGDDGRHAGTIEVDVGYADSEQRSFFIRGKKIDKNQNSPINESKPVGADTLVWLLANGGNGGNGGKGGDGGDGGRGPSGSSASCPSTKATAGGRGGDGGDGAEGGNAGDGGDGGTIRVTLDESQAELLWMFRHESFSGRAGERGRGGDGGSSGSGGWGGSSASCGENSSLSSAFSGSSGSSGSDGKDGSNGREGRPGSAEIVLRDANGGKVTYNKMFEMALSDLALVETFQDGVFEPDESIAISGVTLSNPSPMPSPRKKSEFQISARGALIPVNANASFTLDAGLGANETKRVAIDPSKARFKVDAASDADSEVTFVPNVKLGGRLQTLATVKTVPLSFPLRVEPTEAVGLVVRGVAREDKIVVRNVSQAGYGAGQAIDRKTRLRITWGGGAIPAGKVKLDFGNAQTDLSQPFELDVKPLAAGAAHELPFRVSVDQSLPISALVNIKVEMFISPEVGKEPTKLAGARNLSFMHSLDPNWEFSYRSKVRAQKLKCKFVNGGKVRHIDEFWVIKPKGEDILFKFDHTWWFWKLNDSPIYRLKFNDASRFEAFFKRGGDPTRAELVDIFNTLLVGNSSVDRKWVIQGCAIDDAR